MMPNENSFPHSQTRIDNRQTDRPTISTTHMEFHLNVVGFFFIFKFERSIKFVCNPKMEIITKSNNPIIETIEIIAIID